MANSVVHFEIMGTDGPALRRFYGDLFGWSFQDMPGMDYGTTEAPEGGPGIGGGIGSNPSGMSSVQVYVAVDDPQAHLDRAVALGGTVLMPVTEIPGVVTFALFQDPQGNPCGVVKNTT